MVCKVLHDRFFGRFFGAPPVFEKKMFSDKPGSMLYSFNVISNPILDTYATDDVIFETKNGVKHFRMPARLKLREYSEALCSKAISGNQV